MIYTISIWLLPAIIAITFHEAAHAFVARARGDDTASRLGRVSLNPLKAHRSIWHNSSAGDVAVGAFTFSIRIRQAGACELSGPS
jgi:hypothetical protein